MNLNSEKVHQLKQLNGRTITLGQYIDMLQLCLTEKDCNILIPMYQRNYKWNQAKAVKLTADLIDCYQSFRREGKKEKSIALFTLYIKDETEIHVVDGQQRFITLWLIFKALGRTEEFVDFFFERDGETATRKTFMDSLTTGNEGGKYSSDTRRLAYNYQGICNKINSSEIDRDEFVSYIRENVFLLLHITTDEPVAEFLNLNCNKTQFSACDIVRARLITYENRVQLDIKEYETLLGTSKYREGVSGLFEELSALMYTDDIYNLVKLNYKVEPEKTNENRINLFFTEMLSESAGSYLYDQLTQDEQIDEMYVLRKLVFYKKVLRELKQEFESGDYSNKKIFTELAEKRKDICFFSLLDNYIDNRNIVEDKKAFSKILHEKCSIDRVIYEKVMETSLMGEDAYLINRYFESISSMKSENEPSTQVADFRRNKMKNQYFRIGQADFEDMVQGMGKYLLYRYIDEKRRSNRMVLRAVCGRKEEEKILEGKCDEASEGRISVYNLLADKGNKEILIPSIQRDYCMGSHLERNDFFGYLERSVKEGKEITLSAITVCRLKQEAGRKIIIYDGQQRCLTVALILKQLGVTEITSITFDKRNLLNENWKKLFEGKTPEVNSYSAKSMEIVLKKVKQLSEYEKEQWKEFFRDKVFFDVVELSNSLSVADQFFMDFNEGVQLLPYEIFKCKIVDHYRKHCNNNALGMKLDNEWLQFFYEFCDVQLSDEKSREELMVIRLLEFICFMLYWEKYIRANDTEKEQMKNPFEIECFSKNGQKMGDMDLLIGNLTEKDYKILMEIMERILGVKKGNIRNVIERDCGRKNNIYQNGCRAGFAYYKTDSFDRNSLLIKFLEGVKEDTADYRDIVIWAVLRGEPEENIIRIMRHWNSKDRNREAFAVLYPHYIGAWEHVCLPVPWYYCTDVPNVISGYPDKFLDPALENTCKSQAELAVMYNELMSLLVKGDVPDAEALERHTYEVFCGKPQDKLGEFRIYYYRNGKTAPECLEDPAKIYQMVGQNNGNVVVLKGENKTVALTTITFGSTKFLKRPGEVKELKWEENKCELKVYNETKDFGYTYNGYIYVDSMK